MANDSQYHSPDRIKTRSPLKQQLMSLIKDTISCELIESLPSSPTDNMQKDALLLEVLKDSPRPLLHLYEWDRPSATFGHFIDPFTLLDREGVKNQGLTLAKRPTGGGVLFHLCDLAFSVLIPASHPGYHLNTLKNYAFVNQKVIEALKAFSFSFSNLSLLPEEPLPLDTSCAQFCMAKPTRYDVIFEGKKVGGAAQRRKKWGYLHQGTLSIAHPPLDFLSCVLKEDTRVIEAMQLNSYSLTEAAPGSKKLMDIRHQLRQALIEVFCCTENN